MDNIKDKNEEESEFKSCLNLKKELLYKLEISTEFDSNLIAELDDLQSRLYGLGIAGRVNMDIIYENEYAYVKRLGIMTEETDLIRFRYVNFNLSSYLEEASVIYKEIRMSFESGRSIYSSFLPNLINMPYNSIGEIRPRRLCNITALADSYLIDGILNKDSVFLRELINLITLYFTSDRDLSKISYKDYSLLSQRIRRFSSPQKVLSHDEYEKYHETIENIIRQDLKTLREREER